MILNGANGYCGDWLTEESGLENLSVTVSFTIDYVLGGLSQNNDKTLLQVSIIFDIILIMFRGCGVSNITCGRWQQFQ
jgi:hypothetical protein